MKKSVLCSIIIVFHKLINIEFVKEGDDLWAIEYNYKIFSMPDKIIAKWKVKQGSFVYRKLMQTQAHVK
ncbi:hypothetical protein HFE03_07495 [Paenibacillus sp. EKM102P]|uniref:hypothetical protein n=1 Tax=unclassified Paenibacillus TaxID=185978 RepID=UPI00142DBA6F|nr:MULTISPECIES: hypothetical protein [unclassified Paenibacillus]KAF6620490.1 hypothetical protein HFE00_05400 [Paenibacillus sp. EKM101P]KAF6623482.1 hypothetical protein HFE03_07495 [Paenibacillus sp. EKM102P]KAF6633955.1 hypothetical protein HFE01_07010 [Paenibacillus sp. EKM10P]KAF6649482.1 hypothetical protein HFE02_01975 [Paenibacillus sp. EKM11P]